MAARTIVDFQKSSILILLCLFSFLCYSFFFFKKRNNSGQGCNLPPSPPSLPIIGHLHLLLSGLLHKSFQKLSSKYGPLLYLRVFNVPIILVSSASIAYEIFKTQDENVSARNIPTNEGSIFFGSSGFYSQPYGVYFKFIKKLVTTKLLGPQALERSRGIRADEVNRFYLNLVDKATKKESVEIAEEAMKIINNSICKMIMGKSFSEDEEKVRGLLTGTDVLLKKFVLAAILRKPLAKVGISLFKKDLDNISRRYDEVLEKSIGEYEEERNQSAEMLGVLLETGEYKITRNHIKTLFVVKKKIVSFVLCRFVNQEDSRQEVFLAAIFRKPLAKVGISLCKKDLDNISRRYDEVLEKRLLECDEHNQSGEMLTVLLEACQGKTGEYKITSNHIKSLFVDLFVAGTDTSITAIQWTMAEIINNPKILERLREEIDSVIEKTRLLQETDLPNLPYLQAVFKESLRLHPPAPFVLRSFREACKVKGFDVLEKTTLVVNIYNIMRDPDIWEDPEEFKPERFLLHGSRSFQEDEIREEVMKYIPFGSGRRGCPGSNLANLSVGTTIGVMVQCFDWKIEGDKVNMEEAPRTITSTMAHPLKCTPLLRNLNPLPSIA